MSKYRYAKNFHNRMTQKYDIVHCEEILQSQNLWALEEKEFNKKELFEKVLNSNLIKESFLYSIT
jgi:hypothetical protein